jgi:hypothetical protein
MHSVFCVEEQVSHCTYERCDVLLHMDGPEHAVHSGLPATDAKLIPEVQLWQALLPCPLA